MKFKKAQSSVEYLIVLAIIVLLILPGVYIFVKNTYGSETQVTANQINTFGGDVIKTATELVVVGSDSWFTVDTNVPKDVKNITLINGTDLVFSYDSPGGSSESVIFAKGYSFAVGESKNSLCSTTICNLELPKGKISLKMQSLGDGRIWLKVPYTAIARSGFCGNGIVEGSEECDLGASNTDTCTASYGETCTYCQLNTCRNITATGPSCGDHIKNGPEVCDAPDFGGDNCTNHGYNTGTLTCENNCAFINENSCSMNALIANFTYSPTTVNTGDTVQFTDTSNHQAQIFDWKWFDNNVLFNTSQNPQIIFNSANIHNIKLIINATGLGTAEVTKTINVNNPPPANLCGNGNVDLGEDCDGLNLTGHTCADFSFDGGNLGCSACAWNFSSCYNNPPTGTCKVTFNGSITDPSGIPINGAKVTAEAAFNSQSTLSNTQGNYSLEHISDLTMPQEFILSFSKSNYDSAMIKRTVANCGDTVSVNMTLKHFVNECNYNGICEPRLGETLDDCSDCHCGNGVCETSLGENENTCLTDCPTSVQQISSCTKLNSNTHYSLIQNISMNYFPLNSYMPTCMELINVQNVTLDCNFNSINLSSLPDHLSKSFVVIKDSVYVHLKNCKFIFNNPGVASFADAIWLMDVNDSEFYNLKTISVSSAFFVYFNNNNNYFENLLSTGKAQYKGAINFGGGSLESVSKNNTFNKLSIYEGNLGISSSGYLEGNNLLSYSLNSVFNNFVIYNTANSGVDGYFINKNGWNVFKNGIIDNPGTNNGDYCLKLLDYLYPSSLGRVYFENVANCVNAGKNKAISQIERINVSSKHNIGWWPDLTSSTCSRQNSDCVSYSGVAGDAHQYYYNNQN